MAFKKFLSRLSSAASKLNDPIIPTTESAPMSRMMNKLNTMMPNYTLSEVLAFEHLNPGEPIRDLFHFKDESSVKPWRLLTDEVVGGKSVAKIEFDTETKIKTGEKDEVVARASRRFAETPTRYTGDDGVEGQDAKLSDFIFTEEERKAFSAQRNQNREQSKRVNTSVDRIAREVGSLCFSGVLNLDLPNPRVERSGFAAALSPVFQRRLNLEHYDALEFRLLTDGRIYVAQIKTDTNMDDDLYQAIIPAVKPNTWTRVIIPFSEFLLTYRGYAEEDQVPLDPSRIVHIGFLMAERQDGPFKFNIDWIRAIRMNEINYEGVRKLASRGYDADEN